MFRPTVRRALWRFVTFEGGAVTVEFVILFPALLAFLLLIFATSIYIGTASDVQQLAQLLARASLPIVNGPEPVGDICARLGTEVLPAIIDQSPLLRFENVTFPLSCPDQPAEDGTVTVIVTYDLTGSTLQAVSEMLGLDFVRIERSAVALL